MKIIDINGEERECIRIYPDPKFAGYMKAEFKSKNRVGYTHTEWYPIADFVKNNPKLKDLTKDAPKVADDDLGVVTSATKMTLSDNTKGWKENQYLGFPVWISRGKGEGQTRSVIKNTKKTLTIDKAWEILPDKTSQYVLSYNIHDPQVRGNILPRSGEQQLTKRGLKRKN